MYYVFEGVFCFKYFQLSAEQFEITARGSCARLDGVTEITAWCLGSNTECVR